MRIVSRAFVRPGRSRDFVYHAGCATPALVAAMVNVHGSVGQVPVAKEMDVEECVDVLAQLRGREADSCTKSIRSISSPCSKDTHINIYDPWNILMWKDRGGEV